MHVIKVGGRELDRPGFILDLSKAMGKIDPPVVLVHGGGPAIDDLQAQLGIQPVKVAGLRRTDDRSLRAVMMVLCGSANKELVASLQGLGIDAIGMSGVDGGLLRCQKLKHTQGDLGFVGEVVSVRQDLLMTFLDRGLMPVIAPVSLGMDGRIYNVNADQAAAALASALKAETLNFVSDVPGVVLDGTLLPRMIPSQALELIRRGTIHAGMVPKVRAALQALEGGAASVRIVDLPGLLGGGGTTFSTLPHKPDREGYQ